jgi:orotate phosphoribosyltransferase
MDYKLLKKLIVEKSFNYADEPIFKLSSGRLSNYYIDCKRITLDPEGMHIIGNIIYEIVSPLNINGIGGLTLGADPIAFAVAMVSYRRRVENGKSTIISPFIIRKEPKRHGLKKWIEGNINDGDRVVIVDDVVTTGGCTIDAIRRARESNLVVIKAIALVDREEGGKENIEKEGIPFESIVNRTELTNLYNKKIKK